MFLYTLIFADDQVVMAQSKEDLEYTFRKLQEEYYKWGLIMNIAETKYMSLIIDTNYLELGKGEITGCTEFRYPGSIFTKDGRDTENIRHRETQAWKIKSALNGVWWSKDVTNWKKMVYNTMVKSVLMYGAETWSLYEDDGRRINL